ncbi:hypothetical protein [Nocardiopsis sp. LOL_012]|uniref:hypothetical protein n=1 Tax=Nocardiopsis sp. LOL_012 TaxID=3345409 RepID=UPI003A8A9F24
MRKSAPRMGVLALAAILLFNTSSTTAASELEYLGESPGNTRPSSDSIAYVHTAERNEAENFLSITWSIKNQGDRSISISWAANPYYTYSGPYYSGVTISDSASNRFHPVMDGTGACLCAGNTSSDFRGRVRENEQIYYWSLYSVPADVDTVTVEIPGFEPIEDIPIS